MYVGKSISFLQCRMKSQRDSLGCGYERVHGVADVSLESALVRLLLESGLFPSLGHLVAQLRESVVNGA
jgi:hypothetical protein